jgi:hypothetical protein
LVSQRRTALLIGGRGCLLAIPAPPYTYFHAAATAYKYLWTFFDIELIFLVVLKCKKILKMSRYFAKYEINISRKKNFVYHPNWHPKSANAAQIFEFRVAEN